jgi:glycosyltransferase involved in cell wall biosynthesis
VIVTGKATADALVRYGVSGDRTAVVEPGTDAAPIAAGSLRSEQMHLVSVATITPGKGHEVLFEALAMTRHFGWRLTCAGSLDRHPAAVERLRASLRALGLENRVSLVGELDGPRLNALYDSADLFVLATLHESYGMAVAEALARGLPVVSTTTGAIPELVTADAGILVPPGDVGALADALSAVLGNVRVRARLAEGARRVRPSLPTWEVATEKMIAAIGAVRR